MMTYAHKIGWTYLSRPEAENAADSIALRDSDCSDMPIKVGSTAIRAAKDTTLR